MKTIKDKQILVGADFAGFPLKDPRKDLYDLRNLRGGGRYDYAGKL